MTKNQEKILLELIDNFLLDLSERYGNDGCNDYDLPDKVDEETKELLKNLFRIKNNSSEDDDYEFVLQNNFCVLAACRQYLLQKFKELK